MSLYSRASMTLKPNDGVSEGIDISEGVLEKETNSLLFSILLSDIEKFLRIREVTINKGIFIILLAFADDIALVAEIEAEYQNMLKAPT